MSNKQYGRYEDKLKYTLMGYDFAARYFIQVVQKQANRAYEERDLENGVAILDRLENLKYLLKEARVSISGNKDRRKLRALSSKEFIRKGIAEAAKAVKRYKALRMLAYREEHINTIFWKNGISRWV